MINQAITSFFAKSDKIIEENTDHGPWVFSIAAGDKRQRRETVYSATEYETDPEAAAEISDLIYSELERLEDEPVSWAWIELRERGHSRIWCYEPVNVEHPAELLEVLPDATSDAAAHMASQMVRVNEQLCSLMLSKDRLLNRMTVQNQQLAIDLTQNRTEQDVMARFDRDGAMTKALEHITPMAQAALMYWLKSQGDKARSDEAPEEKTTQDMGEPPKSHDGASDAPWDDSHADAMLERFRRICTEAPHLLTEARVHAFMDAFSQSQSTL